MNSLSSWADQNGFKFNGDKTPCVLFSKLRIMQPDPFVTLEGKQIPGKKEQKFLDILLGEKLSFIPHIKKLRMKCMKADILKVLSLQSNEIDRACLLKIFNCLVRPRLDYGSVVYRSASKAALKLLDPVYRVGF